MWWCMNRWMVWCLVKGWYDRGGPDENLDRDHQTYDGWNYGFSFFLNRQTDKYKRWWFGLRWKNKCSEEQ